MTSKFSIDNRELLQRISSGEAVAGIDFGNLIVRELAAFRLSAMDSEPVAYIFKHPAGRLFWSLTDESNKGHDDVMPVYAAPQSPGSEPATVPGKWIPVSERIPEDRKQVILWDAEIGEVTSGHYSHKTQTFYHCGDAIENEITHWMPPPCAPQGVKP
ncbi:DUF551 domain-containing protein [Klebsiella sp. 2019SCSN059]|nr:DUF551 domain-containing protein [Klebsiella sp. 2019SCSN059]